MVRGTNTLSVEKTKTKIALTGFAIAGLYWVVAALTESLLLHNRILSTCMFRPGLHVTAERAIVISILIPVVVVLQIRMFSRVTSMLKESSHRLRIISRIASVFVSFEGNEAYGHALKVVLDATGSAHGVLGYIEENGNLVCVSLTDHTLKRGEVQTKEFVVERDSWSGLSGRALREKRTFYSNASPEVPEGHVAVTRSLVTPIVYKDNVIGHLLIANKPADYNQNDIQLIEAIAEHLASILHARLIADDQRRACNKALEGLREAEERWRSLTDNTDDFIAVLDRSDRVRYVNKTIGTGTTLDAIGHSVYEFAANDSHELIRKSLEAAYETGKSQTFEASLKMARDTTYANGHPPWFSTKIVPMKADGKVCGAILIATNITDRKRVEELTLSNEQLEQANLKLMQFDKMKSEFLSNVSHEMRTPLASIRAYSESLIEYDSIPREQQESFLRIIVEQSERLTTVLDDLLDLARIEAGQLKLTLDPIEVGRVASAALESVKPLAEDKGIEIRLAADAMDSKVVADEQRFVQILVNLLNNAVKFTGPRGLITVSCEPVADPTGTQAEGDTDCSFLRTTVSDSGEGIPPEEVAHIFDKFKQVDKKSKGKKGGTGLGLAICKELVERMGGQIWVESTLGEGSCFHFTLPLQTEPHTEDQAPVVHSESRI
jgi:PAS domain S-box-containing protein